ncbi:hypothetical protein V6N13_135982 [Hibiscus sabdariffa]|uniref:Uncharacterized protein n=2 Tax=Hibiscus sabdariffa TaxID=183260 RepID=A0ABR2AIM9_9ROSI
MIPSLHLRFTTNVKGYYIINPLFSKATDQTNEILSKRMRLRTVSDIVSQAHILGNNSLLRSAIDFNRISSNIFWVFPDSRMRVDVKDDALKPLSMNCDGDARVA